MSEMSNRAVAFSSHQITVIDLSRNNQAGLLIIYPNSLGRLVFIRGSSDRDNNTNVFWQDETDRFNSLLAEQFTSNFHIVPACDWCSRTSKISNLTQYYLYCFARSEHTSDDRSHDEAIVEFDFHVSNDTSSNNFTLELGLLNHQSEKQLSSY